MKPLDVTDAQGHALSVQQMDSESLLLVIHGDTGSEDVELSPDFAKQLGDQLQAYAARYTPKPMPDLDTFPVRIGMVAGPSRETGEYQWVAMGGSEEDIPQQEVMDSMLKTAREHCEGPPEAFWVTADIPLPPRSIAREVAGRVEKVNPAEPEAE